MVFLLCLFLFALILRRSGRTELNMTAFSFYIIPVVITLIIIAGIARRVDIFSVFLEGAKNGLEVSIKISPALILVS